MNATWEKFQCEGCGLKYAIEQQKGNEIEEPACPSCGCNYSIREDVAS